MRKYVVNDAKNKKYKNVFGVTDYDIPMFGFKSALFICFMTFRALKYALISLKGSVRFTKIFPRVSLGQFTE